MARGQALREAFQVSSKSLLGDRDLRDSWMHFDERLDEAILEGVPHTQRFTDVRDARASLKKVLRLIVVDAMVIRYRDREGVQQSADLKLMRKELERLVGNLSPAYKHLVATLPFPLD